MTSGKQARAERQAKIAAAAPKQSNTKLILGVAIALVVVLAVVGVIWAATRGSEGGSSKAFPAGATGPDGGIVVNAGGLRAGRPTIDIYEDFQCPACKELETHVGATVRQWAASDKANVVYHMKSFLDANLKNDSSSRAANAAACAADAGRFQAFHDTVFANQPAEEGAGFTDDQLRGFAGQAGITGGALDTWNTCVKNKQYAGYVTKVEDTTSRAQVLQTPTYKINGQRVDFARPADPTKPDYAAQLTAALTKLGSTTTSPSGSATT